MRQRCAAALLMLICGVIGAGEARAADGLQLKAHDVIAFVGGEEMLALTEAGDLELLLTRALPDYQLRFRDLAWEGDTVFEQHRDLNYPALEQQLDQFGVSLVIAQFGQMEAFAGADAVPLFVEALEKIVERLTSHGKRRLLLVEPTGFEITAIAPVSLAETNVFIYREAIEQLAKKRGISYAHSQVPWLLGDNALTRTIVPPLPEHPIITRDGVHLRATGLRERAQSIVRALLAGDADLSLEGRGPAEQRLRERIAAKNRLWFHYRRPQNWAFLAGDRVTQPSSHDYRDPSKRWFPGEMEQFLPMIAQAESEIWNAAAKLQQQ